MENIDTYPLLPSPTPGYAMSRSDLRPAVGHILDSNGFAILRCLSGAAILTINLQRFPLRRGDIVLLFNSIDYSLTKRSARFEVSYVACTDEIVREAVIRMISVASWRFLITSPIIRPSAAYDDLLDAWFLRIRWIVMKSAEIHRRALITNEIHTLFMVVDGIVRESPRVEQSGSYKDRKQVLLRQFYQLLAKHGHRMRDVDFYAAQLCISRDYLYKLTREKKHLTPKEIIAQRTVSLIKIYLSNTELSVKNIASTLNFTDTSYMCRFFRRMTGLSPSEYRKQ